MNVSITHHGRIQLRGRLGSGANPMLIARRCWSRHEDVPDEWEVPKGNGFEYLKYGDCVFIFGRGKFGDKVLVTVVGPFGNGKKWESKHEKLLR